MDNPKFPYTGKQNLEKFRERCYAFASTFDHSCILDSCKLSSGVVEGKYEILAAFGAEKVISAWDDSAINHFCHNNWVFGILPYDLKNHFEALSSLNEDILGLPELFMFIPELVLSADRLGNITVHKGEIKDFWEAELKLSSHCNTTALNSESREIYLDKINRIREFIKEGEVYELNYCRQQVQQIFDFDPLHFHLELLGTSPVPMAGYLKSQAFHLCSASMERYLMKRNSELLSQPVKGTIRKSDKPEEDAHLIDALFHSEKDRAENVMIVDLVRNDLSRVCKSGTVEVKELFGIYSYLQVHQMISTISGHVKPEVQLSDIIRATFPMGSMTGTPKIAAMKYIERLETFKRGWYSGALGYIEPSGDFDFNVVIRSLICNMDKKIASYSTGGAITIDSNPEEEWIECKLKAKAIEEVLSDKRILI